MPFIKGQSGNPGGRAAGLTQLRELARQKTEVALNTLVHICEEGESEAARVAASVAILDRGWGKPSQPIDGDGEGGPIRFTRIERTIIDPAPRPAIKPTE